MLLAKIICSDPDCETEVEIAVKRLMQLDGYTCDCGHGFVLASVAELSEPGGEVISIANRVAPAGRIPGSRRRAA